jgi:hypothetical protein
VAGSGIGDSGQVLWGAVLGGVIVGLLGLFFCWASFVAYKSDVGN